MLTFAESFANFRQAGVSVDDVEILILDEADRLLEMGFADEVEELVGACPVGRQTLLFSATFTAKVDRLAALSLRRPVTHNMCPDVFSVGRALWISSKSIQK